MMLYFFIAIIFLLFEPEMYNMQLNCMVNIEDQGT